MSEIEDDEERNETLFYADEPNLVHCRHLSCPLYEVLGMYTAWDAVSGGLRIQTTPITLSAELPSIGGDRPG